MYTLQIFTDGGARGNPGPAAIGVVIKCKMQNAKCKINGEETIASFGKCIGETTNNVAEYTAVVEAWKWIRENYRSVILGTQSETWRTPESRTDSGQVPTEVGIPIDIGARMTERILNQVQNDGIGISFFLDSNLVVNQLNGLFKIKDSKLRELALVVHQLETKINVFPTYVHIPREKNWQADKLVNSALDLPAGRQVSFHVPSADKDAKK